MNPIDHEPDDAMAAFMKKTGAKVDGSKKGRKVRQKRVSDSVDGRSLRRGSSGFTEQFNFKSREGLKAQVRASSIRRGILMVEWMDEAIREKIERESNG